MSKAESREPVVLIGKLGETTNAASHLRQENVKAISNADEVSVVAHVATGRTQVDNLRRIRALVSKLNDMGHHIVTGLLLLLEGKLKVNVVVVVLHLGDLLVGNLNAELLLRLREDDPQSAPGAELLQVAEVEVHLLGGVARRQGRLVAILGEFRHHVTHTGKFCLFEMNLQSAKEKRGVMSI